MAIEYIADHIQGSVLVFVANQSTLKSLFNVKPHSLFELSRCNSKELGRWTTESPQNKIEFRWMPSHLRFHINGLADKAAGIQPIGPFPNLHMTMASRIRDNRAVVVNEWRQQWRPFADNKVLLLKRKKKRILPNTWEAKSKVFMWLNTDITQFS